MVIEADRKSMRYRSCRAADSDQRSRLRESAEQRRRFGYRRLHILLRRDGITINRKKTQRLYREEGLTVRRRKGRKRAVGARAPAPVIALPNQRWSLDFVHDQLATGRRFWAQVPGAQHRRRCDAGVLGGGGRYVDLGPTGGPRARRADRKARRTKDDRQRQRD
jgi:transposase InsO family protein